MLLNAKILRQHREMITQNVSGCIETASKDSPTIAEEGRSPKTEPGVINV